MTDTLDHTSVLLEEVIEGLSISADGVYFDGTFGRGGHAKEILARLGKQGKLIGIDKDPNAVVTAQKKFGNDERFIMEQDSFSHLGNIAKQHDVTGKVNGILLDLGVSSPQLEEAERGFSFLREGPLDMRMDPTSGISAAKWLESVEETEMVRVFREYGEERYSRRIARALIKARQEAPIITTLQLAEIVKAAHPAWEKGKHPATRIFQAIRIFINNELDDLKHCLEQSIDVLAVGGRLVVISFHSLEDRIVKRFMREHVKGDEFPSGVPVLHSELNQRLKQIGRAIKPSVAEISENIRARSAVLRIAEKIA